MLLNLFFRDFIFLVVDVILCGSASVMNVLETTARCVGSLATNGTSAISRLTDMHQKNTGSPYRLSLWWDYGLFLLLRGKTRIQDCLQWVLHSPTRMLGLVPPMELSWASNSCLTSMFLFLLPMWSQLSKLMACSSHPTRHSLILHCYPLLLVLFFTQATCLLPNNFISSHRIFVLKWV
jgi:hypothetical protein